MYGQINHNIQQGVNHEKESRKYYFSHYDDNDDGTGYDSIWYRQHKCTIDC